MRKLQQLFGIRSVPHEYPRTTSARILSTAMNLLVAPRLLAPDDILGTTPTYRPFGETFHGDVPPGIFLALAGLVMLYGLFSDRLSKVNDSAHWFSLIFWVWFAVDIFSVNPSQIGSIAYFIIALLFGYAYYHLLMWRAQQRRERART